MRGSSKAVAVPECCPHCWAAADRRCLLARRQGCSAHGRRQSRGPPWAQSGPSKGSKSLGPDSQCSYLSNVQELDRGMHALMTCQSKHCDKAFPYGCTTSWQSPLQLQSGGMHCASPGMGMDPRNTLA